MIKPLVFLVAGMAALAGCQSGDHYSKADKPAANPAPAQPQPQPTAPAAPALEQGQQSGSLGSFDNSQPAAPADAGSLSSSDGTTVIDGSAQPAPAATSDIGSSSAGTPASDEKTPERTGTVLTNEGPLVPSANVAGSQASAQPAAGDAASTQAVDSLHVDHAGSATAQPPLGDRATLGETDSDRQLVGRIRQAVVDDETISPQGRAVQIQSEDGQLVLKGQVGSERERQRIGDTAFRESGGKMVINRLEISDPSTQTK